MTLPALISVPVAIIVAALLFAPLDFFSFYAYQNGFALPSHSASDVAIASSPVAEVTNGQPLSLDPRDFQKLNPVEHVIRIGDTISGIAVRYGLLQGTILSANAVDNVRRLLPGTVLSIPDRDGQFHVVQPGDSVSSIASVYGVPMAPILDANALRTSVLSVGETLFVPGAEMDTDQYLLAIGELFDWPVRSFRFTSGYGMRSDPITGQWRMHSAIDLANAVGTPIYAARPGRVDWVDPNTTTYGNVVIIDHGDGFRTLYSHLQSYNVRVGQLVGTSTPIGRMGNTGRSTGPHLHFAVIRDGRAVDPMLYLPPRNR